MKQENEVVESENVVESDDQLIDNAMAKLRGSEDKSPAVEPANDETDDEEKDEDESGEGEDEKAVDPKSEDEDKQEKTPKIEKDPKDKLLKQNKGLTRIKHQLTAEKQKLADQVAQLQKEIEAYKKREGDKPTRDQFATEREFERAIDKHEITQQFAKERLVDQQATVAAQRDMDWESRVVDQVSDYETFKADYTTHYETLNREAELVEFVKESDVAPKMIEAFITSVLKNPAGRELWRSTSSYGKRMQLAQLEQALLSKVHLPSQEQSQDTSAPVKSKAPKVIAPESKSLKQGGQAPVNDDELIDQTIRQRKKSGW